MPPATKTLSQAELTKLEHAFATDPVSEAYKPLAEAYLGMGRFMEAMVVCKKGVKAHPNRPDPRILLARVYADQGKDKKAVEELNAAMQIAPTDKGVLRMMGALQIKTGEADAGRANLLKAFEADRTDAETLEVMGKHGVTVPREPEPVAPPPPPPAPVVVAAPVAVTQPNTPAAEGSHAPASSSQQAQAPARKAAATARPAQAQARPPQRREYEEESVSEATELPARRKSSSSSGSSRAMFFLLIFIVPLSAAGYYGWGQYKAKQIRDANKLLRDATDKLKTDTFAAYQVAIKAAEDALSVNASADTNRIARGLLAYGYTVRWGEHQHDSDNKEHALSNIKAGIESKDQSNYLAAADALFDYYDGKGAEALKKIDERIKTAEADKKQVSIFYLTQGLILMNTGSLDDARTSLERAQIIAPDDPRVFVALGNLQRRRGADMVALTAFNNALKYTRNSHPDALLGTANLILDQDNPGKGYITASQYVKTLLEMEPPPSPRELAEAHFVKALLISRVTADLPQFKDEAFKKELADKTGVSGDKSAAAKEIDREEKEGLGLDRSNPELSLVKGRRLAAEGKIDEAAVELRKAIELNGTAAQYHVELAKVLMRKDGGDPAAEEVLKKALSLVPNSPKLLTMLGQVQARQKKYGDAEATLEKATSDEKARNPDARFLLGKLLRDDKKDYERAIKLIDRSAGEYFNDTSMAATAYDELGVTLELRNKDGDKDRARGAYEKAFGFDKEYPPVLCHYAKFLTKLNDAKEKDKLKGLTDALKAVDPQNTCMGGEKPKEG
jgi:tetratricopeptide (TPR) repeat protein